MGETPPGRVSPRASESRPRRDPSHSPTATPPPRGERKTTPAPWRVEERPRRNTGSPLLARPDPTRGCSGSGALSRRPSPDKLLEASRATNLAWVARGGSLARQRSPPAQQRHWRRSVAHWVAHDQLQRARGSERELLDSVHPPSRRSADATEAWEPVPFHTRASRATRDRGRAGTRLVLAGPPCSPDEASRGFESGLRRTGGGARRCVHIGCSTRGEPARSDGRVLAMPLAVCVGASSFHCEDRPLRQEMPSKGKPLSREGGSWKCVYLPGSTALSSHCKASRACVRAQGGLRGQELREE